ncbi:MAG: hypothetical protein AAGA05_10935 [Pseudomonadota bacterium]
MTLTSSITSHGDSAGTEDFRELLRTGLEQVQKLSNAHWTDYNEHDPGVTILETLVFALTDIGYRTNHPIEDILASSSRSTGTPLSRQPLFPGTQVFTTAPVTAIDFRKLIYDRVSGVRNAWLQPTPAPRGIQGLYDVLVQTYPPVPSETRQMIRPDGRGIAAEVRALLWPLRGLGLDFDRIEIVAERILALNIELAIDPDTDPNATVARILFAAEYTLNPPPEIIDVEDALARGTPPEDLFEGPLLDLGCIRDDSLGAMMTDFDLTRLRAAILGVEGVATASGIRIDTVGPPLDPGIVAVPVLSREPNDLSGIKLTRNGAPVALDPVRILSHLHHFEERSRWREHYAIRRMSDAAYGSVHLGKPDRDLSRYRSIQHLFPAVYGIGENGAKGARGVVSDEGQDRHAAQIAREAKARQLKAYLLVFEQMLADHLSQLDACADLLALPSDRPTYAWQPIARPAPHPDDPPNIAPVLGASAEDEADTAWFSQYKAGMTASRNRIDRPLERRSRALDHLLARFGESFDNEELRRLFENKNQSADEFQGWLLQRKAAFLADVITLGGERGLGIDLTLKDPDHPSLPAALRRIALKSGHDAPIYLIEHILLRDGAPPGGIGTEEIKRDFVVAAPPPEGAVALRWHGKTIHWVLDPSEPDFPRSDQLRYLLLLGANPVHYKAYPPGSYQISVRLDDGVGLAADVLENFHSMAEAREWISWMSASCQAALAQNCSATDVLTPVFLPLDAKARGLSVVFCPDPKGQSADRRALAEDIAAVELPAHLATNLLWLAPTETGAFADAYAAWRKAQTQLRATAMPSHEVRQTAAGSSQDLLDWVSRLYCRDLRGARAARRREATT